MSAKLKSAVLGSKRLFRIGVDAPSRTPSSTGEAHTVAARGRSDGAKDWRSFSRVVRQRRLSTAAAFVAGTETSGRALLFLATPHEASRSLVPEAIAQGLRVIDLSGAWRLKQAQHRAIYSFQDADAVTAAELTAKAVYGLPELNGDRLPAAQLVANPGCYATSVILALAPLLRPD